MKFHAHETLFEHAKRNKQTELLRWERFYAEQFELNEQEPARSDEKWGVRRVIMNCEWHWYYESRPYYKVFPAIIPALTKIPLDVKLVDLPFKERTICIRFAEEHEPVIGKYKIELILSCLLVFEDSPKSSPILITWPVCRHENGQLRNDVATAFSSADETIESWTERIYFDFDREFSEPFKMACRTVTATILLADDPSIITPDVLAKDRDRYDRETDEAWKQRAVDRARRRGIVGWNIGADYEICPHYRRPHFGLRHTGKGGTVPRIVPIKGAVVHRSRLTEVPTGYMLPDGTEVEHGKVVSSE